MPQLEWPAAQAGTIAPLPRPLTSLIARESELAATASLLRDPTVRLLTLTGPGGVGKTRLAIAVATNAERDFPDGVVFVDLSQLRDPGLVLDIIAGAYGLRDSGTGPLHERLLATAGDRRLLLVLDNFEHVVTAAPGLLTLLERCPNLKILVTSRIRLRVSGEREYSVAPLPLGDEPSAQGRSAPGAVQLFVDRARAVVPDLAPDEATLQTIGEIVRRVDGLPLAVELAAARIRVLPPHELLKRMELRLPMLSGGARDLPLRQQTMRDTIGWSYDLLDPRNRMLFRWLGVFAGGFTLDAAEALSADALDGITTLVEHSLLRQRAGPDGTPRYFMLETVREYARDRLEESGEQELAQQRHAGVYLALAERAAPMLTGAQQVEWLDRLERDHGNLRAALQWSLDQPDPAIATRLGAALWLFWRRRGFLSEGRLHLERILALPEHAETLANRCSMLTGAGALALFQGEYDAAIAFSEQAISGWRTIDGYQGVGRSLLCMAIVARHRDEYELADRLGQESLAAFQVIDDRWGMGRVLGHLGMLAWVQGDHETGTRYYEEALEHFRAVGDGIGTIEVLLELGKGACDAGDLERATAIFVECLELSEAMGDLAGRGVTLTELGVVAWLLHDYARAKDLLTEATALAQTGGDRRQIAYLAAHLGDVDFATGDTGQAATRYAEALEHFSAMGNRVGIAQGMEAIARCGAEHGHDAVAVRLLSCSVALFDELGVVLPPHRHPRATVATLEGTTDPATFHDAWETAQHSSLDEAVSEALGLAAEIAAEAGPPPDTVDEQLILPENLGLTRREVEVLHLLADGLSDREIADALSISERTAGNHVQHAMQKIGVSSRTAAAVFAVRNVSD